MRWILTPQIILAASLLVKAQAVDELSAQRNTGGGDLQKSLSLDPKLVLKNIQKDGQEVPTAGQSPSLTSVNNFINFCATRPDLPLTDGTQIKSGSCNPVPMGIIVAQDKTPSCKFQFPTNFAKVPALQNFDIVMKLKNLEAGKFVNPQTNYYGAPATTNSQGIMQGHTHFVVQKIPSFTSTEVPDVNTFAFFKGVNTPIDGEDTVRATVTNGLDVGFYRLASINTASNHQPVSGPVAQRGAIDDIVYFEVVADGQGGSSQPSDSGNQPQVPQSNSVLQTSIQPSSTSSLTSVQQPSTTTQATVKPGSTQTQAGRQRFRQRFRQGDGRRGDGSRQVQPAKHRRNNHENSGHL